VKIINDSNAPPNGKNLSSAEDDNLIKRVEVSRIPVDKLKMATRNRILLRRLSIASLNKRLIFDIFCSRSVTST